MQEEEYIVPKPQDEPQYYDTSPFKPGKGERTQPLHSLGPACRKLHPGLLIIAASITRRMHVCHVAGQRKATGNRRKSSVVPLAPNALAAFDINSFMFSSSQQINDQSHDNQHQGVGFPGASGLVVPGGESGSALDVVIGCAAWKDI